MLQKEIRNKLLEEKQVLEAREPQEPQEQQARQKELVLQGEEAKNKSLEEQKPQKQQARQKELVLQEATGKVKHKLLEEKQDLKEERGKEQKTTTALESKVDKIRILLGKSIKKSSRLHKVIFRLKSYNGGDAIDGGTIISKIVFQDLVKRIFHKKIVKKHASLTLG